MGILSRKKEPTAHEVHVNRGQIAHKNKVDNIRNLKMKKQYATMLKKIVFERYKKSGTLKSYYDAKKQKVIKQRDLDILLFKIYA